MRVAASLSATLTIVHRWQAWQSIGSAKGAVETSSEHAGLTLADGSTPFITWAKFSKCCCTKTTTTRFSRGTVKAMTFHDDPACKVKDAFKPGSAEAAVAEVQVDKGQWGGAVWIKAKELKEAWGYHYKDNPSANTLPLGWHGANDDVRKVARRGGG
jgi:hypothetical protein